MLARSAQVLVSHHHRARGVQAAAVVHLESSCGLLAAVARSQAVAEDSARKWALFLCGKRIKSEDFMRAHSLILL